MYRVASPWIWRLAFIKWNNLYKNDFNMPVIILFQSSLCVNISFSGIIEVNVNKIWWNVRIVPLVSMARRVYIMKHVWFSFNIWLQIANAQDLFHVFYQWKISRLLKISVLKIIFFMKCCIRWKKSCKIQVRKYSKFIWSNVLSFS